MSVHRLNQGGCIDRKQPLQFDFDGRSYSGFQGDTLASALLGAGVRLTARSFKYHRPRGIVSSGVEEPSSYVHLRKGRESGSEPVTRVELVDGLSARSVRGWPSASFDVAAAVQFLSPLIPASFYYKTFMWPGWRLYEPAIRNMAGLAPAPIDVATDDCFEARDRHCDVLVIGGGPAGLSAALVAARAGLDVLVVDQEPMVGGALLARNLHIESAPASHWLDTVVAELTGFSRVEVLTGTVAWAHREHNLVMLAENKRSPGVSMQRIWRVRAQQVVLATGANERLLVFANNDRPGIMLASAIQAYAIRYAVRAGRRAVLFTTNDSVYQCARDLHDVGIETAAIIDVRDTVPPVVQALVPGVKVMAAHEVYNTNGGREISGVLVRPVKGGPTTRIGCDLLGLSGGWNPAIQLWSQARLPTRYCRRLATLVPEGTSSKVAVAGACNGRMALREVISDGLQAGLEAARRCGQEPDAMSCPECESDSYTIEPYWHSGNDLRADKAFVDLLHDVTLRDIHLAISEGFAEIEHVKRYTTAGMALDQGRTGNLNVAGAVAMRRDMEVAAIGTTTFRPPTVPVRFGGLGQFDGLKILPYRTTPVTPWHRNHNAVMYEAGARWRRPGYYPQAGESMQGCINREARAVRNGLGIYDGAPLGTFEIQGRDASRFLDLVYTNVFSTLHTGQGRYGLMLTDDGLILDDGVSFCLGRNRFLMSTSTANAGLVRRHMKRLLAVDYPELEVRITDVTSVWMNATLCGPLARSALERIGTDIDISPEAFPFMGIRHGIVAGFEARVARVSFTGELSFEINVRARHLAELWEHIFEVCREFDITPIGSETSHVLRVEKGFLSLGHEVDGTVDAFDLGMGWAMASGKPDFIGKRAVSIRRSGGRCRRELVGLWTEDPARVDIEGAPLVESRDSKRSVGHVTASVWSVVQERAIALALLENGRQRHDEVILIRDGSGLLKSRVTAPCFHDPKGKLLRS